MAANQSACPPVGILERLLAEELGPERDTIESHVEACSTCQEELARLSAPTFLSASAGSAGAVGSDLEPDEGFLRRLRESAAHMATRNVRLSGADASRFPGGRLGRYEILEKLATGGMGAVYRARHVELGKVVALKVLPSGDFSEMSLARFKNEMRAIGRLHHPHIVAAHDAGEIDGIHFLAMDFVDGVDLAHLVQQNGRLSVANACDAIRQAALGLQHAFEKGLVHRDVKPSNLMLARGGLVQVLDLGLARACEDVPSERLTAKGALLGTADYLAPEQWEHPHAADIRADIYGLGCTLYHLLAGSPPFVNLKNTTILSKMRAHLEQPPPPVTTARPDVPAGLAAVLNRMLAKAPADRFQTPAEVARALQPFAAGADLVRLLDATTSRPPSPAEAAATPGQAALDTVSDTDNGWLAPTRRYGLWLALAGLGAALAVAAVFLWPKPDTAGPEVPPVAIEELRVSHFRGKEAKPLGDLRSSEEVRRRDDVKVFARLSRPAYCYLIAFNPDGSEQLCHPSFEGTDPLGARKVVPPELTELRFFPDDKGYFNLDVAGLQAFVLVVASNPLPSYAEWRAGVGQVPWRAVPHGGDARWQFDGQVFSRLSEERGSRQERDAVPTPLRELGEFFKSLSGVDAVRVVAFPVTADNQAQKLTGLELELARQGRFEEAKEPVRELIAVNLKEHGEKHWATAGARRELQAIERVAALPEADRVEYTRALRLLDESIVLQKQGRYPEAVPLAKRVVEVLGRYLGTDDFTTATVAVHYGTLLRLSANYAGAETVYREALANIQRVVGDDHPYAASVRVGLALAMDEQDKRAAVRPLLDEAIDICRRLKGPDHPDEAVVLNNLAGHLERQGQYDKAEPHYRRSLDILVRAQGNEASTALTTRGNLGYNLTHQGKYSEGESLYREVLKARLEALPDDHPDVALVRNNLATNLDEQGRYADAEDFYRQVYDVYRRKFGADNPLTAMSGSNLGLNLQHQAKYEAAEQYLVNSLAVFERAGYGRTRPAGLVHNNLAANYRHVGRFAEAREHVELALAILRERLGDGHPIVAECFNNLAATLTDLKKHAEAEGVAREAVSVLEKTLGREHPLTAVARVNLANGLHNQAKYAEAGVLLRDALETHRRLLGEGHPRTAWAYKNLIANYWAEGQYEAAANLGPAAIASFELARLRYSFGGLGRVGPTDDLSPLRHLAAAAARTGRWRDAWRYLEAGMARGLLDDLAARPLTDAERAREKEMFRELDRLDGRIARLATRKYSWLPGWSTKIDQSEAEKLRRERDEAQGRLIRLQTDMAARHGVAAGKVYDLAEIQKALRPDAALVAWLDISGDPTFKDPSGDHWVCIVRHTGDPVWERLPRTGPDGAWTDDDLAQKVRGLLSSRADAAKGEWKAAVAKLYRQRLVPIEPALEAHDGLPRVRHLVVLAASQIAGVPVEALVPDGFVVSYAPSGSTFTRLQESRPDGKGTDLAGGRTFFAVADPEFGPPDSGGTRLTLPPLPGTRTEVHAITRLFSRSELLLGAEARESNLEKMAADGRLREFRFLHFATHGLLDDRRPLASALVLAREPAAERGAAGGRLTAQHIVRTWKLDADLVTLSACETALGPYSRGEGFLGFSQALLLAGARGTVLSLWPVEDRSTTLLMTRFYENMLGTIDGKVKALPTKAEALAEAKRWLRDLTASEVELLTRDLPRGLPSGTRGVRRDAGGPPAADAPRPFSHPYYWSAFILIGDPR